MSKLLPILLSLMSFICFAEKHSIPNIKFTGSDYRVSRLMYFNNRAPEDTRKIGLDFFSKEYRKDGVTFNARTQELFNFYYHKSRVELLGGISFDKTDSWLGTSIIISEITNPRYIYTYGDISPATIGEAGAFELSKAEWKKVLKLPRNKSLTYIREVKFYTAKYYVDDKASLRGLEAKLELAQNRLKEDNSRENRARVEKNANEIVRFKKYNNGSSLPNINAQYKISSQPLNDKLADLAGKNLELKCTKVDRKLIECSLKALN